ncbi:hypothetical protein CEP88_15135 [Roseobacter denitrificans]|uniref:hypothetical protein n=1 Tax=Roseobacter denitrificans TaxID=2434 RepID=UPI0006808D97|nr:hypothetical protein [Roseobacter denitrificans]AVL53804.1 hypothetical protein CEP88_15135 [Roseobacter denitrificans]SFG18585.1 hypothetical protein SAMN05443635_10992 [Roseobacter denitrificans OCh 114]
MIGWFKKKKAETVNLPLLDCGGQYQFDIVGEASYQIELEAIAGKKTKESKQFRCHAAMVIEDNNRHDPEAVRVVIDSKTVGYLSRADARHFRKWFAEQDLGLLGVAVSAEIVGGWKDHESEGHFGVKLDFNFD